MPSYSVPRWTLSDGNRMPAFAFGTGTIWFKPPHMNEFDDYLADSIKGSLEQGCHHIDTADEYNTYKEIGHAIKSTALSRDDVFVTSKILGEHPVRSHIQRALELLGLSYLDMCLIHFPFFAHDEAELQKVWLEMESVHAEGLVRSLGVSNFLPHHLDAILNIAKVKPVVNQVEFHPLFARQDLIEYHRKHGITTQGYGIFTPLVKSTGEPLISFLEKLSKKYNVSTSAILLEWSIQQEVAPVTTTSSEERLSEYMEFTSFSLEKEEVATITSLGLLSPFRRYLNTEMENLKF